MVQQFSAASTLQGIANPAIGDFASGFRANVAKREGEETEEEFALATIEALKNTPGAKYADLIKIDPARGLAVAKSVGALESQDAKLREAQLKNVVGTLSLAADLVGTGKVPPEELGQMLLETGQILSARGIPVDFILESGTKLINGTPEEQAAEMAAFPELVAGFSKDKKDLPAEQLAFEALIADFSPADKVAARRRKAGLDARAVGSAGQTIAEEGTAEDVAAVEETLARAKETGKLKGQLILAPQIAKAVTIARKKAEAQGDAFTDLARSQAALPGLKDTVAQLKDLALIATSTMSGRVFDTVRKEIGFGPSKGKTARTKFIAIINNQVLPLLKLTFGGSFSVQEGQELKATMGDPDSSPEEKLAQLDAFIAQKERDIATKSLELGSFGGDLNDLSDNDLLNF